eukprot:m.143570 g.143570  ORF g.143570 m.143570 type:complete len:241 (+) comp52647_c0_seq21:506-1228(+)
MIILFFRLLLLLCMILLRLSSCRFYRAIIEDVQIMTIVREPLSHALSWLTYTQAVNDMNTLVRLIPTNSLPENPMALDLGLRSEEDIMRFLTDDWHHFSLICIMEAFDECLVMMRRKFNWNMQVILYMRLLDKSVDSRRWDGAPMMDTPHIDDLPFEAQSTLRKKTSLDHFLYAMLRRRWEEAVLLEGPGFQEEVRVFKKVLGDFQNICKLHPKHPYCRWSLQAVSSPSSSLGKATFSLA